MRRAFAFRAELDEYPGVVRTIAVADDQTLEQLHEALRLAFGWAEPHLYSFWIGGRFWDEDAEEYTAPEGLDESSGKSAHVQLAEVGLQKGTKLAYLFDFGDEWRVNMRVVESWSIDDG